MPEQSSRKPLSGSASGPSTDFKLLAVDLDGTLLRRDNTIHDSDVVAIAALQSRGVPVTIVTGRLYSGSREAARAVRILGPIACVDGSQIVDARDDRGLLHAAITGGDALELRRIVDRHCGASFLFVEDGIVHDDRGQPFAPYVRTWSPNITVVERVTDHPDWEHPTGVLAVVAVGPEAEITGASEEIGRALGASAFAVTFPLSRFTGLFGMVVRAHGPTKGTAIRWLSEHHGCGVEEVVAVGDWLNDLPMFDTAGRSFAMGQAPEVVKQRATDHLAADVSTGGGIAEAIAAVWGIAVR